MQNNIAPPFGTEATNRALEEASRLDLCERKKWINSNLSELPDYLHKYMSLNVEDPKSCEKLHSIIVDSYLWLCSPRHFNDPFDMTSHIELEKDAQTLRKFVKKGIKDFNPELGYKDREDLVDRYMSNQEDFKNHVRDTFRSKIEGVGVCCLSEDPVNILMWSHYAEKHSGFAMRFSVVQDVQVFARSLPVEYSQEYPVIVWPSDSGQMDKKIILGKHDGWKYEKEFRVIHPTGANSLLRFKPEALTGIYIGCRTPEKSVMKLKSFLDKRNALGYPTPELFQVNKHSKKYGLEVVPYKLTS
ncbi:MAG: DUF2971 domain-containing protein [Betaproteobacteria bacterium]|nr:DUF2971 domain-containing protein [Betaproteobacteria bacterium]